MHKLTNTPSKCLKIGIAALLACSPLLAHAHHVAQTDHQVAGAALAGAVAIALGLGAYLVKSRRSIFGRAVAGWLDNLHAQRN